MIVTSVTIACGTSGTAELRTLRRYNEQVFVQVQSLQRSDNLEKHTMPLIIFTTIGAHRFLHSKGVEGMAKVHCSTPSQRNHFG